MALDYGMVRTGVAVSDPTGTLCRPLCVVKQAHKERGLGYLAGLVAEHGIEHVVVGLPLTPKGERGAQAQESERFAEALRARLAAAGTQVPVTLYDERFTTAQAARTGGGAAEDARAAAHLLESWLHHVGGRP